MTAEGMWYLTFERVTPTMCALCMALEVIALGEMDEAQAAKVLTDRIVESQSVATCEMHEQTVRDNLTAALLVRGIMVPDA